MIHGHLKVSKTLSGGLQSQNYFHLYTDILIGLFHCADIWTEDAKATVALGTNQDRHILIIFWVTNGMHTLSTSSYPSTVVGAKE